jgi:hypothetical protein
MALSGRILGLKFMQRALTKQKEAENPVETEAQVYTALLDIADITQYVINIFLTNKANPTPQFPKTQQVAEHTTETAKTRCVIIEEGDPPPASQSGRLSFKVPGPDDNDNDGNIEKKAPSQSERTDHDTTITDEDMAARLANNKEQENGVGKDKGQKSPTVFPTKRKNTEQEVRDKCKAALLGPVQTTKIEKKRKQ